MSQHAIALNNPMWGGIANGIAAGALWGLVFLVPAILAGFSPLQLATGRYLVYGIVAVVLLLPRWTRLRKEIGKAEWLALAWLSLLGNLLYYVLLSISVQWSGSAAASLIVGMMPVLIAVIGSRRPGALALSTLLWPLLLCVSGVGLMGVIAMQSEHLASNGWQRLIGLLCAAGALFSWTIYSIANMSWLLRRPDISSHDWSLLTGITTGGWSLGLVPVAFFAQPQTHSLSQWSNFWMLTAVVAVLASVLGGACWNRASRSLPLTLSGQLIIFETLFVLLYSFVWQQRLPLPLELLAAGCLATGVIWSAALHRPKIEIDTATHP